MQVDGRGQPREIDNPSVANGIGSDGTDIGAFEVNHRLVVTAIRRSGSDIQIGFTTLSDKSYDVRYRLNIDSGSWISLPGPINGTGGIFTYLDVNTAEQQKRFYRILQR